MSLHSNVSTARFNKMVYSPRLVAADTTRLHRLVESGKLRHSAVDGGAPFVKRIGRGRAYIVELSSTIYATFLPQRDVGEERSENSYLGEVLP